LLEVVFDPNNYPFWIIVSSIIIGTFAAILRPFSTYVAFVYPNAKLEAIGNPYIIEKELNRIIDSKDVNEFKDTLNASKDYNISGENIFDIQKSLDENFIKTIEMMKKDSSKKMKDFYDIYSKKLDIYLIKNALKNKLDDKKINESILDQAILPATKDTLTKIIDSEKLNLSAILNNYGFEKDITDLLTEEKTDYMILDNAIDKHIIKLIKNVKVPYNCDKAKQRFVNNLVDVVNIKNVLRAKQLGYDTDSIKKLIIGEGREIAPWKLKEISETDSIPQIISSLEGTSYYNALKNVIEDYDKEKSVQILENALDGHLLKLVRDISTQNFVTIGPTFRFIISKEFEIKNLKIIVKGIGEDINSDVIKPLLIKEASI